MLIQSYCLSSLLFTLSVNANLYPPVGLKPRYLATGTGISLSSTNPPPYPTAGANGSSVATGSAFPTSSPTSNSTATPTPTSSGFFYLIAADTGTDLDGDYVSIGSSTSGNGLYVLYLASTPNQVASFSTFSLNADGTLQNEFVGGIAAIFPGGTTGTLMFTSETLAEENGDTISFCEVAGGTLTCETGAFTVFFVCPYQVISGTLVGGTVDVGLVTQSGCTPLSLRAVPV